MRSEVSTYAGPAGRESRHTGASGATAKAKPKGVNAAGTGRNGTMPAFRPVPAALPGTRAVLRPWDG